MTCRFANFPETMQVTFRLSPNNMMKTIFALVLLGLALAAPAQPLPAIKLQPVFPKLSGERPVWMSEAPDGTGRMFIVYQDGKILIVHKGADGSDAKEFLNIVNRNPHFENEDGLLSLAFHPGFATNGLVYVYYNQKNSEDKCDQPLNYPFRSIISEFKVSATNADVADLKSERILLVVQQPFSNHKGGELVFGPDGYLYLGLGDGGAGDDPYNSGQNCATLLAKILRLDVNSKTAAAFGDPSHHLEYGIPQDNPFTSEPDMGDRGARKEIYALGLRNPWRFSFDRANGALWCGDVGQNLWEEVDLIVKGGNYGWNVREGAHHFKPGPEGAKYPEPVMEYPHNTNQLATAMYPDAGVGLCVIGGYVYRGKQYPALTGVYLYADYNFGTIWGFRYDYAAQKLLTHGTLLKDQGYIVSFAEDGDGEVYVLRLDGKIFQVVVPNE